MFCLLWHLAGLVKITEQSQFWAYVLHNTGGSALATGPGRSPAAGLKA